MLIYLYQKPYKSNFDVFNKFNIQASVSQRKDKLIHIRIRFTCFLPRCISDISYMIEHPLTTEHS